jgi:hypothetical protein
MGPGSLDENGEIDNNHQYIAQAHVTCSAKNMVTRAFFFAAFKDQMFG